jgi:hypothetical protein
MWQPFGLVLLRQAQGRAVLDKVFDEVFDKGGHTPINALDTY